MGIIFILILIIVVSWIWYSLYQDNVKSKAIEEIEKKYNLNELINNTKVMLSLKKYFSDFNNISIEDDTYVSDKSLGHCPKCNKGYLERAKTFTGFDDVYNKYPTYYKFLKCTKCGYTENHSNLKSRKLSTKRDMAKEFNNDFLRAYALK